MLFRLHFPDEENIYLPLRGGPAATMAQERAPEMVITPSGEARLWIISGFDMRSVEVRLGHARTETAPKSQGPIKFSLDMIYQMI
jgi:hypothetical protein